MVIYKCKLNKSMIKCTTQKIRVQNKEFMMQNYNWLLTEDLSTRNYGQLADGTTRRRQLADV